MPLWQELPCCWSSRSALAVLIRTFLVQAFFIPSGSMEQTLLVGDRVLVNKVVYDFRDPRRGEIVVFRGTAGLGAAVRPGPGRRFRQQARPHPRRPGRRQPPRREGLHQAGHRSAGDRVTCCDEQGRITVNGVPLDEPYVPANSPLEIPPNRHGVPVAPLRRGAGRRGRALRDGRSPSGLAGLPLQRHRSRSRTSSATPSSSSGPRRAGAGCRSRRPSTRCRTPAVAQATAAPPAPEPTPGGVAGGRPGAAWPRVPVQCRSSRQRRLLS